MPLLASRPDGCQPADAHEGHRQVIEQGGRPAHERLLEQHVPRRLRSSTLLGAGRNVAFAVQQVRQAPHEVGRVAFRGRVAAAAQDLHDLRVA